MNRRHIQKVAHVLHLSERELRRTLAVCAMHFVLMVGWGSGSAGCNGLFIKEIGPDWLPVMYILNAAMMILVSAVYSLLVRHIEPIRFFIVQAWFFCFSLAVMRLLLPLDIRIVPFLLYSFSEVIYLVMVSLHLWTYANQLFDPRIGKIVFPTIGGFGILGVIVGGALTKPIVDAVGTANLFVFWCVVLVVEVPLIGAVGRYLKEDGTKTTVRKACDDGTGNEMKGEFREVWQIPLIRNLVCLSVPMWFVIYLVDFQFYTAMDEIFHDQDELTGFLGIFRSVTAFGGLILQFFLTGFLLRKFGVGLTFLFHPLSMATGAVALALRNTFAPVPVQSIFNFRAMSAMYASFADDAVFASVGESSYELLFNAIPEQRRAQARAFVSGTVVPLCTMMAGTFLLVLMALKTSPLTLSLISLGLSLLWIYFALRIRSGYLQALVANLGSRNLITQDLALRALDDVSDPHAAAVLMEAINQSDVEVALYSIELLENLPDRRYLDRLSKIMQTAAPRVQTAILDVLTKKQATEAIPTILTLLPGTEKTVRVAAIRAIGAIGEAADIRRIEKYAADPDVDMRAEIIISMIRWNFGNDTDFPHAVVLLQELAAHRDPQLRAKAAYIIGEIRQPVFAPILFDLGEQDDPVVIYEVISACGKLDDDDVIENLVKFLDAHEYAVEATGAIMNIGRQAIPRLHQVLRSENCGEQSRVHIIQCLGKLGSSLSISVLAGFLKDQPVRIEFAAAKALATIKNNVMNSHNRSSVGAAATHFSLGLMNEIVGSLSALTSEIKRDMGFIHNLDPLKSHHSVTLLIDALTRSSDQREQLAFHYLQLLTEPRTIHTAMINLTKTDLRKRAEAIEIIEGCSQETRDLVDILETKYLSRNFDGATLQHEDVFRQLLHYRHHNWILMCTINAIGELRLVDLTPDLIALQGQLQDEPDEMNSTLVNAFSRTQGKVIHGSMTNRDLSRLLQQVGLQINTPINKKEQKMIKSQMQRMLFLRSVPIFADVEGSDLQFINEIASEIDFAAGEVIFEEHDEGDSLYLIESGSVKVVTGKDREITLTILRERDSFGEMSILDRSPRSASVIVETHARLLTITHDDFHTLLFARPQIAFSLFKTLNNRLRILSNKFTDFPAQAPSGNGRSEHKAPVLVA